MMERYAEMRESGVPWIQDIPTPWGVRALFQLSSQVKDKNTDLSERNLLSLSYGKIKRKDINTTDGLLPESFDGYNIIEANDIVLRLTDLQNDHTSLRVGQSTERGIITSAYTTIRPSALVHPKYLYYVIHAYDLVKGFYGMGSGVRQGLKYDEVKAIRIPFPDMSTQANIVAYLDDQCNQIDSVIANLHNGIDEFRRWKASIVLEAVTKGLDPSVEVRDSKIRWIGEIPKHWGMVRMKDIFFNVSEKNHPNAMVLSLYRDFGVVPKDSRDDNHNVTSEDTASYKFVRVNDLVINKMKAWQGSLAVSAFEGIVSPAYYVCRFRSDNVNKRYIHYLLRSKGYAQEFERLSTGMRVGQWDLGIRDFMQIPVVMPPFNEQVAIAEYLDDYCTQINSVVDLWEPLISDLESFEGSLIYDVVTGKRKVV